MLTFWRNHGKLSFSLKQFLLRLLIIIALISAGADAWSKAPVPELKTITAAELKTKIKGSLLKATVVNLWATWCPPCVEEMPDLLAFQKKYSKKGVGLVLISADNSDDLKAVTAFLERQGVEFQTYRLGEPADAFMKDFVSGWPASLPTTLLFGSKAEMEHAWLGRVKIPRLEDSVELLLRPKLASPPKIGSDRSSNKAPGASKSPGRSE